MNVSFDSSALGDSSSARYLTEVFWMFVDGRHRWAIEDSEEILDSNWYKGAGTHTQRAIAELARVSCRSTRTPHMSILPTGDEPGGTTYRWDIPANLAAWHLSRPLLIAVENSHCDGAFVRLILTRIGQKKITRLMGQKHAEQLKASWSNAEIGDGRWLEVRHGGGGTLAKKIELIARQCPNLPPRLIVLVDSDRSTNNAPYGPTAKDAINACEEHFKELRPPWNISPFVLKKREVENYIPLAAILRRYANHPLAKAYKDMRDPERDFFDLKLIHNKLYDLLVNPAYSAEFHDRALRERAGDRGQELDALVSHILNAL